MNIIVNVANQKLKVATDLKNLVAGTRGFIHFVFKLPSEWNGLTTFAQFTQKDSDNNVVAHNVLLDENNTVDLPALIQPGTFTLMLYGTSGQVTATTNYLEFHVDSNILINDASSIDIDQSIYEQLIADINARIDAIANLDDEEIKQLIANQITDVITEYISSDEFVQRTISIPDDSITAAKLADGAVTASKADAELLATLNKADTAMQPSVYDPNAHAQDIFAYAATQGSAAISKLRGTAQDAETFTVTSGSDTNSYIGLDNALNGVLGVSKSYATSLVSNSTLIVNALPVTGSEDVNYIVNQDGKYMLYKYINNAWELIAGGTAEVICEEWYINYYGVGSPDEAGYIASSSYEDSGYLDTAALKVYLLLKDRDPETGETTYLWDRGHDLVESPSEFSDYYIQFGETSPMLHFRYNGELESFVQVGKSAATLVVETLPDVGSEETDYILNTNGDYNYYKYIGGDWVMISGGGGDVIVRNYAIDYFKQGTPGENSMIASADFLNKHYLDTNTLLVYQVQTNTVDNETSYSWESTALVDNPSEHKDYYLQFNGGALFHFRYVGNEFVQIGTDSYSKDETDFLISGVRSSISGYEGRISTNESNISSLNNAVTNLQQTVNNLDTEGYRYYATYGTAEINGEETPNVYRLYEVLDEQEEIVSQFVIQGGGGGGGGTSTTLTVERVTTSPLVVTPTDTVNLVYTYSSYDDDEEEVDGTYIWKLGGTVISSGTCVQGTNSFDVTEYCTIGTQKFTLTITDEGGNSVVKSWTVQKVDVRIESSFNDRTTYPIGSSVNFTYTPYGSIQKTIHFKLDGVELDSVTTSASGVLQSYSIPAQLHGAHLLECWATAVINGSTIETLHILKDIIWYDELSTVPVIGCIYRCLPVAADAVYDEDVVYYLINPETNLYEKYEYDEATWDERPQLYYSAVTANQYDSTSIDYVVYNPNSGLPTVIQTIDGVSSTRQMTTYYDTLTYKSSEAGVHTIVFSCGSTSIGIIMDIIELDIDVSPITANLAFDFNPTGLSNSSADRIWVDENDESIAMSVSSNFDWANGGYQVDENGNQYFCVKAGTTASFSYNLFGASPYTTGSHFKLIFKTSNVSDITTTWMTCYTDSVGLLMKAHQADLVTSVSTLESPYSEEDIIEFEYDIQTLDTENDDANSLIMAYEDGVAYRPLIYDGTHRIHQYDPVGITFGSENCDVMIYRMKAYTASLTDSDTISNFIADALDSSEMISRYNRNQIYNDNGILTPESLAAACPDLKVIKIDAPKFTNNKSETILDTTIQCIHTNGDPILDNWTARNCGHSGQGTTSNEYGIAGRNMDLKLNQDNTTIVLGDGTTFNDGSGKITLTRTSVPTNYLNVKVNIASSENVNNALLANRYDRFLPYETPAKRKDPKVKTTMEFVNCAVFIRENDPDLSTHREFNDTSWHFYGIGNVGDSKKTDKTRVHDSKDMKEFVNEILDNTLANSIFDTGVYNMIVETLPETGQLFIDYYMENGDGTYTLSRYLDDEWVTVSETIDTIQNGAVSIVSTLPSVGVTNVEYYVEDNGTYTMYTYVNGTWSTGTVREEIINSHMANSIDPKQWIVGNPKYDSLHNAGEEKFGTNTYEMRYEPKGISSEQHAANLQIWYDMYEWVVTSTDEEFVNEFEDWFIKDALIYYYVFTERYTMTDNRAKNSFWHWGKFYISESEAAGDYANVADYYIIDNAAAAIHSGYRFDLWDYDNDGV